MALVYSDKASACADLSGLQSCTGEWDRTCDDGYGNNLGSKHPQGPQGPQLGNFSGRALAFYGFIMVQSRPNLQGAFLKQLVELLALFLSL